MKLSFLLVLSVCSILGFTSYLASAASVEPGAGYTNDFSIQPLVTDWSTVDVIGASGDAYDLDEDVNLKIAVAGVGGALNGVMTTPPSAGNLAVWSSNGGYLQTRSSLARYVVLLGKFVNNSTTNATAVSVSYRQTTVGSQGAEDKGTRVYYSLTGAMGSWTNIPAFNTLSFPDGSELVSATLSLLWSNKTSLYLLWADDNAAPSPDPAYQIDNFSLQVVAGEPDIVSLTANVTSPPSGATLLSETTITASAKVVLGVSPITVEFFTNSGLDNVVFTSAGQVSAPPYALPLSGLSAGTYRIYARAIDSASLSVTTNSSTNTFFVADPLVVSLDNPADGITVDNATSVMGSASMSGGREAYAVQFLVDGFPVSGLITVPPYQHNLGPLFVGDREVSAKVTDASGWVSTSAVHTIHVTGPLGVFLLPTNGATFRFGESISLQASPGGGTLPYRITFYTNGQAIGSPVAPPYRAPLGILPPGTYAAHADVADSSSPAQQASSQTNVFTVLPNPLQISFVGLTSTQVVNSDSVLTVMANVMPPLTIRSVEFSINGTPWSIATNAPYTATVTNLPSGPRSISAIGTDNLGRTATSSVQVIVRTPARVNDHFSNAVELVKSSVITYGSTVGATKEPLEPSHATNAGGASVWWKWTAPVSGWTTVTTAESDFNTLLGVYFGDVLGSLTLMGQNDDYFFATYSSVDFYAYAGEQYHIAVDGRREPGGIPETGNIKLRVVGQGDLIVTPTNGSVLTFGEPFSITVTTEPNFTFPPVTRMEFYHEGLRFATDTNAPFSVIASNWPAGSNSFYAVATDRTGNRVYGTTVNFLVQDVGLTILSPGDDTYFSRGTSITVSVWGYLPSGSITNVEFFIDGRKFGESSSLPFQATWTNASPGPHRLIAKGRSDAGDLYVSPPVYIGVTTPVLDFGSEWKYLDDGSNQGTNWTAIGFNDSEWKSGRAQLGYGDGDEATVVEDNPTPGYTVGDTNRFATTYFRKLLVITNRNSFLYFRGRLLRDDAGVIHINGREVFRSFNLPYYPNPITYTTFATDFGENTIDEAYIYQLANGTNVIAVEIHQHSAFNLDVSFDFGLVGHPYIPHNAAPVVSLLTPTNGSHFLGPNLLNLEATAFDEDGNVIKVEFFVDGLKVGEDNSDPYSVVWENPPFAAHTVTAVATDNYGNKTTSEQVGIVVYDEASTPVIALMSPPTGTVLEGPTNIWVTATANSVAAITNVEFLATGVVFGSDQTESFSVFWAASFGTNVLTSIVYDVRGMSGTSPPVNIIITIPPTNTVPPAVVTQFPQAGATITNLTTITVRFNEFVQNVDASDLLINGVPASTVNAGHSRSNFTFTFPPPPYGPVNIAWASAHGITDYGWPAVLPLDENSAGNGWTYNLIDVEPPIIVAKVPAATSTATNLSQISVTFSELVSGVNAADLLVNGVPSHGVSSNGTTYTFDVAKRPSGIVTVAWAADHGITDFAVPPNPFNRLSSGASWSFTLDTRTILVQSNSTWKFFPGLTEASTPSDAWRFTGFNDSGWSNAFAPFFYGDPYSNGVPAYTHLLDMRFNYSSIFLRNEFTVPDTTLVTNLAINAQSDDGFIVWINGVETARYNMTNGAIARTGVALFTSPEPANAGAGYLLRTLTNSAAALVNGVNTIAIQAFNESLSNHDFGFNAQVFTYLIDSNAVPPRIDSIQPSPGDLFYLTNITVNFSEGVSGVSAGDLLVNGVPATSVSSSANTNYSFRFTQPAYGQVSVTWATNHGIADFDTPPKNFNGTGPGATFRYTLFNPSNPRVAAQVPAAGSVVTGLTSVVVTFTEPVGGVEATDFLINNLPAAFVTTGDGMTYTFAFNSPGYGPISITWAEGHGITDLETPAHPFDPFRFGARWNYTLVDPVPSITITTPTNNTYILAPATITLNANASDNDGTIATVRFFSQGIFVSEDTTAPYSLSFSNLAEGGYVFHAVATDNLGFSRTSAPVTLHVVTNLPVALVRGPYLQMGTTNSALIRWRTASATDALVYYGTDLDALTNVVVRAALTNEHIVLVHNLAPDTKYFYSIGNSSYRSAGGPVEGSNYWFKTSPLPGTRRGFRFWVLGDAGTAGNSSGAAQQSTRNAFYNFAAKNGQPDLWLMLGDNAYNSGTDLEYQRAVFDMYPATLRNFFLWPTIGNHETGQSSTANDFPYLNIFSLPMSGEAGGVPSGTEKYYSFDYGNVHFVCLDSMTSGRATSTPMLQWLRNDLESTAQEWVIVFFHHPPLTKGSHDSDWEYDLAEIRSNFVPIFEANGVDLVLSGHSHCWERSFLLHGHHGDSTTFSQAMKVDAGDGRENGNGPYRKNAQGHGIVYTVAGNAGQVSGGPLNHPAHFISLNELGTMVIDVSSNRLDAISLTSTGTTNDHFTLLKADPAPETPLDLLALVSGPDQILLVWTPARTNADSYSIERSLDGVTFSEQLVADGEAATALDSNVLANTTYYYRVKARNHIAVSAPSRVASVTTVVADAPPKAPSQLLVASEEGLKFYRSTLILTWQDSSSNEAGFQIERSLSGAPFTAIATVAAGIHHFIDRELESATRYNYRVRAFNALGSSTPSGVAGDETHPKTRIGLEGATAVFHAGIEGASPIAYQWFFNNQLLAGQTNEALVLANLQPSNEGDYMARITDANRIEFSNPAYLFVVGPPKIVVQPRDALAIAGTSGSIEIGVTGTPPFTYQWRHDGTPIPGASNPSLVFTNFQLFDDGAYDVVVSNDFGQAISAMAHIRVIVPPSITPQPLLFGEVLKALTISNAVVDLNDPPLELRWAVLPGSPSNARLDASSGTLFWVPQRDHAAKTNVIHLGIWDWRNPSITNTTSILAYVADYVELSIGSAVLAAGTNGSVPLTLFSSTELERVAWSLNLPGARLNNLSVENSLPALVSVALDSTDTNHPVITLDPIGSQSLQGTQQLGRLRFNTVAGQASAFVPLAIDSLSVRTKKSEVTPTPLLNNGRVVVIGGLQPLLEQVASPPNQRLLMLYGSPTGRYEFEYSTNSLNGPWRSRGTVTMTNYFRVQNMSTSPPPPIFYRARQR